MSRITALWALTVLACVAGQPFLLGFYADDWPLCAAPAHAGARFSKALFETLYLADPSRPGLAILRFLSSSVLGDRVFLWHSGLVLANLLVALILIYLIRLLSGANGKAKAAAIWIGLSWLLLP